MIPVPVQASRVTEVAALGYHEVTPEPLTSGFVRPGAIQFTVTPDTFARHLDLVRASGVEPVLVNALDEPRARRPVLLTFDDGGKSAVRAADALAAHGWRGHFFVITGRIGDRTFLDAAEIRALRDAGHLIGSHSHTHPDIFRELPFDRMVEEWRESRDRLENLLGEPCTTAAVPGGHISTAVFRSADQAGVRALFTCDPVLRPQLAGECRVFGRFLVKATTSSAHLATLLAYEGWRSALMVRRTKDLVRRAMPSLFRLYQSRRTRELASSNGVVADAGTATGAPRL